MIGSQKSSDNTWLCRLPTATAVFPNLQLLIVCKRLSAMKNPIIRGVRAPGVSCVPSSADNLKRTKSQKNQTGGILKSLSIINQLWCRFPLER